MTLGLPSFRPKKAAVTISFIKIIHARHLSKVTARAPKKGPAETGPKQGGHVALHRRATCPAYIGGIYQALIYQPAAGPFY